MQKNITLVITLFALLLGSIACGTAASSPSSDLPDTSELEEAEGFNIRVFALESGSNGGALSYQACYVPEHLTVPDDVIEPDSDWVCTAIKPNELIIGFAEASIPDACADDVHGNACTYWLSLIPEEDLQP